MSRVLNYLFLESFFFFFKFWSQMWGHILNIHLSELLSTKTKESKINELKKKIKKVIHNNKN